MSKVLKAACIGLRHGHASGLIGTFKQLSGVQVVAFCEDSDAAALERLRASDKNARFYTRLDDLLQQEAFEVACVALPASEVPAAGAKLARAGKHFIMEKQFARTAADMIPMVQAIEKHRVKVLAHFPWRRHPVIREIKRMLDEGLLGKPLAMHAQLVTTQVRPGLRDPQGLFHRHDTEGGGILHMLGGHWIEAMRYLMGCEVSAVSAFCRPVVGNMQGENMDDASVVGLEFANGAVANLHMGYLQAVGGNYESGLALWGSEGSARWEAMGGPTFYAKSRTWNENKERAITLELTPKPGVYGGEQWLYDLVQDFIDGIHTDRQPAVTALDGLRVLEVIDAAYESSRTGRRVDLEV